MRPRILLNLGVFAVLGVVMLVWAGATLLPIRIGERTFQVRVEFESFPGLREDLEVDYLGVKIGRVDRIALRTGRVDVTVEIDEGVEVPRDATAQVLRKSAVGEPYVEFSPPASRGGGLLADGDVVPLANTKVAVEYQRLFDSAGELLKAVKPADIKTLTGELATGLEGQGDPLRDTVADLDQLTGTLAENSGVLDALAVHLTQLAGTLAGSRTRLASGLDDLAAFTGTLSGSRAELDSLLDRSPGFLEQVNGLLEESKPGARCLLTALETEGAPLFTDRNAKELERALTSMHKDFPVIADHILITRPEGMYAKVKLVLTLAGPVSNAEEYATELAAPAVPPVYYCKTGTEQRSAAPEGPARENAPSTAAQDRAAPQPFTTVVPRAADSADEGPGNWLTLLPIVAGSLVLLGVAAHTVRRFRNTSR
ncbi:MCE family protein [Actinocorallia populi]|uniref:MCE family protein n=1 Tax=Actinocorallia populi TaxID=2079200 RepID=UPI000D08C749|nr:MCE family protein [Actinocorallia populi]